MYSETISASSSGSHTTRLSDSFHELLKAFAKNSLREQTKDWWMKTSWRPDSSVFTLIRIVGEVI